MSETQSRNDNVDARTPKPPFSLQEIASTVLDEAREADHGHAAVTLTPNDGGPLKQTLVAVRAGGSVGTDRWNGVASLQVVLGSGSVGGGETLQQGDWTVLEDRRGEISAEQDLVALLTVAT